MIKLTSIESLFTTLGGGEVRHPLIEVMDLANSAMPSEYRGKKMVTGLYSITIKTKSTSPFQYGRTQFDFAKGTVFAMAPDQSFSVDYDYGPGEMEGYALHFHPDLLLGTQLHNIEQSYGFFSYDINEALHLSDVEQQALIEIMEKTHRELSLPIDEFSKDILVANLELLLNYVNRYFHRQFITRQQQNSQVVQKFKDAVEAHFTQQRHLTSGLPSVEGLAQCLHISPGYLSDLLKREVNKTSMEFLHSILIDKAKVKLLSSEQSVAEIAFSLGFEYPQYFSRLFKQKTGFTPSQYRLQVN